MLITYRPDTHDYGQRENQKIWPDMNTGGSTEMLWTTTAAAAL
jgi:hypothetical protein